MTNIHPRNTCETSTLERGIRIPSLKNSQQQGVYYSPWTHGSQHSSTRAHLETLLPQRKVEVTNQILSEVDYIGGVGLPSSHGGIIEDGQSSDASNDLTEPLGKKKTPMCLVNELARHHKFQPQYRLTEESGPPHQKTFVVTLKLGEEEYTASGQSIKKAQHAAAQMALSQTAFQLPEPKPKVKHSTCTQNDKPITPTVELNALAMKLNLPPVYTNLPAIPVFSPSSETFGYPGSPSYSGSSPLGRGDFRLNQGNQRGRFLNADLQPPYHRTSISPPRTPSANPPRHFYNRFPTTPIVHRVSLAVGKVFVTGEGPSPQAARHDAARQALEQLQRETSNDEAQVEDVTVITEADTDSDLKSPVSLVHELALKLNQPIEFVVLSESGPPHMRNFVVQCKLGDYSTQGEGNCKKLAKKKAAELMLEELKKAHPNGVGRTGESISNGPQRLRLKSKPVVTRKKPRNLVKEMASESNGSICGRTQDPISQLVQLQQARKEKEPFFAVVSERGIPRQPEFVVQVTVGALVATGVGPKKKDAKRAAALKALEILGVNSDITPVSVLESTTDETPAPVLESNFASGREMLPGLLLIRDSQGKRLETPAASISSASSVNGTRESTVITNPPKTSGELRHEISLNYLARVLEYEVEYSDFPKGKKGEFVTLVTLNTVPPQVSHGLGSTLEEAHDNAAANMLKLIADGRLDTGGQNKENTDGVE